MSDKSYSVAASETSHAQVSATRPLDPIMQRAPLAQRPQLPIDLHYDKWSRFENFLKFAEKKELRDRLKELDPPPISNFVDPSTIESITKARKKPPMPQKPKDQAAPGEDHKKRIQQMRELYGLFLKMEEETDQKLP